MGAEEEVKQQDTESKPGDQKNEEKKEEESDPSPPPPPQPPPPPLILHVEFHCTGCTKKIQRSVLKVRGVEEVEMDIAQNQVKIKGVVNPQEVCDIISKKTKRRTRVISPLPASEGDPLPQVVISQVSGLTSVELNAYMHCEACADQLRRKILKMRGVQTAETEASTGKVTVTGTMDPNKLVEYVYKRTKKQARIVPQPEPDPKPEPAMQPEEEAAADDTKPAPEAKPEDEDEPQEEAKKEELGGDGNGSGEANNKDGNTELGEEKIKEESIKESGDGGAVHHEVMMDVIDNGENVNRAAAMVMMKNGMMQPYYYYQPISTIERIPYPYPSPSYSYSYSNPYPHQYPFSYQHAYPHPPQLFSDENPNACCIS